MHWHMQVGLVGTFRRKLSGSLRHQGRKIVSTHGEINRLTLERLSSVETKQSVVPAESLNELVVQASSDALIWLETYGNGAPIGTVTDITPIHHRMTLLVRLLVQPGLFVAARG